MKNFNLSTVKSVLNATAKESKKSLNVSLLNLKLCYTNDKSFKRTMQSLGYDKRDLSISEFTLIWAKAGFPSKKEGEKIILGQLKSIKDTDGKPVLNANGKQVKEFTPVTKWSDFLVLSAYVKAFAIEQGKKEVKEWLEREKSNFID